MFYRRYVDGTFVLLSFPDHADKFTEYLLSKHLKVNFSLNREKDGYLQFLNVKIFLEQRNLQITFVENRSPAGSLTPSKALDLGHIKLVSLNHYYFGVSVYGVILSNSIMQLIH